MKQTLFCDKEDNIIYLTTRDSQLIHNHSIILKAFLQNKAYQHFEIQKPLLDD